MSWRAAVLISTLVTGCACASDGKAPPASDLMGSASSPPSSPPTMPAFVLTAAAPTRELPLMARAVPPTRLVLAITAIENPSARAFSVATSVQWRDAAGSASVSLDEVVPYPADARATFQLAIPEAAGELLTRKSGHLSLSIALKPIAADRPLAEPLVVTFGEPSWLPVAGE